MTRHTNGQGRRRPTSPSIAGLAAIAASLALLSTGCSSDSGSTRPEARQATTAGDQASSSVQPLDPDQHRVPSWFTDAKFGIFVHWGVYSVPAWAPVGSYAEWYWFFSQLPAFAQHQHHLDTYGPDVVYDDFIDQWDAERWDPEVWIELFRQAGAKYWVLVTKHHDGFALWPSTVSDRNSVELGPRRDIVGEMMAANEGSGMKAGLYYSLPEWFTPAPKIDQYEGVNNVFDLTNGPSNPFLPGNPPVPYTGYKQVDDYATGIVEPQIRELIDRYHPSILWCDIGGDPTYYRSADWLSHFYGDGAVHHPEGVVANNRCGLPGDYSTPEYAPAPPAGDRYFEATRGLGHSFGYNRAETVEDYLSDADAIWTLIDTVAAGGNLLLDVGPRADGTIPEVQQDRLRAIGDWLEVNGSAIYSTAPWEHAGDGDQRFTVDRDGNLYLLVRNWSGGPIIVNAPVTPSERTHITLLGGDGERLRYRRDSAGQLEIDAPTGDPSTLTTSRHAVVFRLTDTDPTAAPRPACPENECNAGSPAE